MTLDDLIEELVEMQEKGFGHRRVFTDGIDGLEAIYVGAELGSHSDTAEPIVVIE